MARTKNKKRDHSPLLRGAKILLVLGLWLGIALAILTAWYATELPKLVDSAKFERSAALTVTARNGDSIARYGELQGMRVGVEELPNHLIYAVMAVEDRRFYEHFGIDPWGMARAMLRNVVKGRVVQGGSTITQQLAKNLFLSHERTLKRKLQEAMLALWLEHEMSKDEILTAYLNRVYLGAGAYGVEAAAQTYFNKPATSLSLYESAMLAGLLKAPSRYSPQSNPGLAAQRARVVLSSMHEAGYITEDEEKNATLQAQAMMRKPTDDDGDGIRYFTDWVTGNLDELIGKPDKNLTIETTLDPAIQKAAAQALHKVLAEAKDKKITQGAVVVMARDGAILAMVGGGNYRDSQFNRAVQSKRPPGSAFKPFVYLTALEAGWDRWDDIEDAPLTEGKYRPANFDGEYYGMVTLNDALAHSLNTAAVRLMRQVGVANAIAVCRRLGITEELAHDLSLSLGSSGIPLIEMVAAYGGIANDGLRVTPYTITRIKDDSGMQYYFRSRLRTHERAVSTHSARELQDMMQAVIEEGTGRGARLPFDASGKTGTSQDFRDAWFIGFTDKFVAGVWLGNDDNSPMDHVTGGSYPAIIWRDTMLAAHNRKGFAAAEPADESHEYSGSNDNEPDAFTSMIRSLFNE